MIINLLFAICKPYSSFFGGILRWDMAALFLRGTLNLLGGMGSHKENKLIAGKGEGGKGEGGKGSAQLCIEKH